MPRKAKTLIVVGGGIWGLACAYTCARRGWQVTVVEAASVGSGASGGVVGAMAPHTPDQWNAKKQFQFEALASASSFWRAVEEVSGCSSGYGRIGRWQPLVTAAARDLAGQRIAAATENWQGRFHWSIQNRPPVLAPEAAPFGVIHDTLSARIDPLRATNALAQAARRAGVAILENRPVQALTDSGVRTGTGELAADATILAAGVGGFELLAPYTARHPGRGQKGQAALLAYAPGDLPQIYADGIYIVPHADGTTAIGSTSENSFADAATTDSQLDDLIARATRLLPALASATVRARWAALRPKPRRRDPMLGQIPGLPNHFAALGAFKIGFGLAHKVGETLADMLDGDVDLPESFTIGHHCS